MPLLMLQLLQSILKIKNTTIILGYLNKLPQQHLFWSMVSKELSKLEHIYIIDTLLE